MILRLLVGILGSVISAVCMWVFFENRILAQKRARIEADPLMRCKYCRHWEDDEDDFRFRLGYCGHPFHGTPASEHYDYGGHWSHENGYCLMFEK